MFAAFVLRNWKFVAGCTVAVVLYFGVAALINRGYERGRQDGIAETSAKFEEAIRRAEAAIQKREQQMVQASKDYQKDRAERSQNEQIRRVTVQKIMERPVYHGVCFDADGLSELNRAIADAAD